MKQLFVFLAALALFVPASAESQTVEIHMHLLTAEGLGQEAGTITAQQNEFGTLFTPALTGLAPGLHGFHLHQNADCGAAEKDGAMVPGAAAGGHYDPTNAGHHAGPFGDGHLGDLPALYADAQGNATHPVLAPRVKLADLHGRSLMIHAGGDNYSDEPAKLGGGGARFACGVAE